MSGTVDLSVFPMIRLDQISRLDDQTLERALDEVSLMMNEPDFAGNKMAKYFRKQYDAMLFERSERQAALRVQQLLSGAIDALHQSYSPREKIQPELSKKEQLPEKDLEKKKSESDNPPVVPKKLVLRDTPLSTNIAKSDASTSSIPSNSTRPAMGTLAQINSASTLSTVATQNVSNMRSSQSAQNIVRNEAPISNSTEQSDAMGASEVSHASDRTTTPRSISGSTPRIRKIESPAGSEDNVPSKKSVEIVYRNFGNEFIVAATERKRRFVTKKETEETIEQRKERERLERRKIAMERLVKRREDKETHKLEMRERRRQDKLKKLQKERGDGSSSDSESVSGDDDVDVKVDESLVPAMQAVLQEDRERTFVVKLAPGQRPRAKPTSQPQNKPAFGRNIVAVSKKEVLAAGQTSRSKRPPLPIVSKKTVSTPHSNVSNVASNENESAKDTGEQDVDSDTEVSNNENFVLQSEAVDDTNESVSNAQEQDDDNGNDESVVERQQASSSESDAELTSEAPSQLENTFFAKNLSALATIRKLKEAKMNKSTLASASSDQKEEEEEEEKEDQQRQQGRYMEDSFVPAVEDIVEKAMAAVDRVATSHMLSRPTSRAYTRPFQQYSDVKMEGDEKSWTFDKLLPMLLAALHVQRVVHSAEVDLLQAMGDTIMFNFGPDDLPGLRALQLVHHRPPVPILSPVREVNLKDNSREFRVSLEEYHNRIYSEENADIFDYRSMKRREIPVGLVLLAVTSHRILFGKVSIDTVQDFNQAWMAAIQSFDNQASRAKLDGLESAYFALVQVCGNGYAICKKLEVLLEGYFSLLWENIPANNKSSEYEIDCSSDTDDNLRNLISTEASSKDTKMSRVFSARRRLPVSSAGAVVHTPARSRRDSQDSLLDFLQVQNSPAQLKCSSKTLADADLALEQKNPYVIIKDQDSDSSSEPPPPSSAAVSLVSHSNPASRPISASSTFQNLVPASLSTVYGGMETDLEVKEFVQDVQQRNQRPFSGRRSAAAAKFRSAYLDSNNEPLEGTVEPQNDVNGSNIPDKNVQARRRKIAEFANRLHAEDVFPLSTDDNFNNTQQPVVTQNAQMGKNLISFSQLEEELAAADAALAQVLHQQQSTASEKIGTKSKVGQSVVPQKKVVVENVNNGDSSKRPNIRRESGPVNPREAKQKQRSRLALASTENTKKEMDSHTPVPATGSFPSSGEKSSLVDYYPQFAMIFPIAYSQSQQVRDDTGYARVILESMQVQAKVYEEWVDVMRDYSTVFCHNQQLQNDCEGNNDTKESKREKVQRPKRARRTSVQSDDDDDNGSGDDGGMLDENEENRRRSAAVYKGGNRALHYRVKSSRSEVFNIVCDVFQSMLPQWESLPGGLGLGLSWNLLWTWSKPRINRSHLLVWQKVNHFEESRQLTRKDFLKKNIERYTDMPHSLAKEFEIMPLTFLLPHEYNAFVSAYTNVESQRISGNGPAMMNYWILKPVGLSRGRGISMIRDLGDVTYAQASVIQKYVENPLCLQQYKFDLRIYVVVTSFKPLEAFIYREGFARVSLEAYSTQPKDMDNLFIHLTNSSIQKKHTSGPSKDNPVQVGQDSGAEVEVGGSKISLLGNHGLWKRLEQFSGGKIQSQNIWDSICTLIVKSLVVVDDKIPHQPNCFELFGYDILIDENLRPWLIEVNASPSLARENALDQRVKNSLIRDIIELLDVAPYDRAALARVMRKRLNNIAKQRHVHGRNDADLEQDLQDILGDYRPRRYGEIPSKLGQFERLVPDTPAHQQVLKLKKKLFKDA